MLETQEVNVTDFQRRVYEVCSQIPSGKVSTYKEIGKALGLSGHGYRAIGGALNKNPFAPTVPCHRVVASDGSLGGFAYGCEKKVEMLAAEGVLVMENKIVDFSLRLHRFTV